MNRWNWLTPAIAALALAALPFAAEAQAEDNDHCSNETLRGDYAFTVSGQVFLSTGTVTREGVAMTHFDGSGHFTQFDFVMQFPDATGGASPVPGVPDPLTGFHTEEHGTYQVFPDCTGEFEIDFPPAGGAIIKTRFVLSEHARHIHAVVYSVKPPFVQAMVPALIHSEGEKR